MPGVHGEFDDRPPPIGDGRAQPLLLFRPKVPVSLVVLLEEPNQGDGIAQFQPVADGHVEDATEEAEAAVHRRRREPLGVPSHLVPLDVVRRHLVEVAISESSLPDLREAPIVPRASLPRSGGRQVGVDGLLQGWAVAPAAVGWGREAALGNLGLTPLVHAAGQRLRAHLLPVALPCLVDVIDPPDA